MCQDLKCALMQHFIPCCWYSKKSEVVKQNITSVTLCSYSDRRACFFESQKCILFFDIYILGHIQHALFISATLPLLIEFSLSFSVFLSLTCSLQQHQLLFTILFTNVKQMKRRSFRLTSTSPGVLLYWSHKPSPGHSATSTKGKDQRIVRFLL